MRIFRLLFQRDRLRRMIDLSYNTLEVVLLHLNPESEVMATVISVLNSLKDVIKSFGENFLGMDFIPEEEVAVLSASPSAKDKKLAELQEKINNFKQELD